MQADDTVSLTPLGRRSMQADDAEYLKVLIADSPLLDSGLRKHWLRVLEWLPPPARLELADILVAIECT